MIQSPRDLLAALNEIQKQASEKTPSRQAIAASLTKLASQVRGGVTKVADGGLYRLKTEYRVWLNTIDHTRDADRRDGHSSQALADLEEAVKALAPLIRDYENEVEKREQDEDR